ncbi:hypothetical protein L228DRAFT_12150 [Xylona heveae TC161]|uniref:Uncharacterized protein n=1 Tax=Xylona heveae (strain CBS 132557 / TC161) TaxID=1328760 RepID=A0A165JMB7_XYLHT|nr:hypothetical protein L228DRAFT_12150 [Xylona heveae TC161]KZF26419.1 hypothetical protein L228DRAFT_12150 [Xylona heveae TC161]
MDMPSSFPTTGNSTSTVTDLTKVQLHLPDLNSFDRERSLPAAKTVETWIINNISRSLRPLFAQCQCRQCLPKRRTKFPSQWKGGPSGLLLGIIFKLPKVSSCFFEVPYDTSMTSFPTWLYPAEMFGRSGNDIRPPSRGSHYYSRFAHRCPDQAKPSKSALCDSISATDHAASKDLFMSPYRASVDPIFGRPSSLLRGWILASFLPPYLSSLSQLWSTAEAITTDIHALVGITIWGSPAVEASRL